MSPRPIQLGFPPSVGISNEDERIVRLGKLLSREARVEVRVSVAPSYQELGKQMQLGQLDLAWAPPFIAARLEAAGFEVALRGVRKGVSTYRSALVTTVAGADLEWTRGKRVAWIDRDSVSGYLLPFAFLKMRQLAQTLSSQEFTGSYRAALERVANGGADFTAVYAAPASVEGPIPSGLGQVAPELASRFHVIAFTDEVPSSGLVVSSKLDRETVIAVTAALKGTRASADGELVEQLFLVDAFEAAPKSGYRALYKLAVAAL